MAKFWGKLFIINFAMGVVTGIVQEFQFGMNWSEYSRFMGDIFGAPLAIEALVAFFLESTFLGVWIFGWDRLPRGVHTFAIWMVALGANVSALWILIANSFMQEPVGYVLRNGRAEMDNFWELITNPHVGVQFPHVLFSGVATAAFFVLGISAWHLLRKTEHQEFFQRSARMAAIYGAIGVVAVALVGHSQAQHMVEAQPMKMAAAEALYDSVPEGVGAPFSIITVGTLDGQHEVWAITVPKLLSYLSTGTLDGAVEGINDLQAEYEITYAGNELTEQDDYRPIIPITYWTFRLMMGFGFAAMGIAALALFWLWKGKPMEHRLWYWGAVAVMFLPLIANSWGWIFTEMGRQPWLVFGLMGTSSGVSPGTTVAEVATTMIGFTVLYGVLAVIEVGLIIRYTRAGAPPYDGESLDPQDRTDDQPFVFSY